MLQFKAKGMSEVGMGIIDAHCDALSKLYLNPDLDFYLEEKKLDVSYPRLHKSGVMLQFFAIYIPESLSNPTFEHVLQFVDLFHRRILHRPEMHFVKSVKDLQTAKLRGKIGAILTLEGADALMGNYMYLRILFQLGVRFIGITWNYANWAADGVMEPRKGGFTRKGKLMLKEMEKLGMIVDVSHLSEKGFWELTETSPRPFIASHSNAQAICPHPRNLSNEQIRAIISCKGRIGITFVPHFLDTHSPVSIQRIFAHLDHICALGGEHHVGFGSDFDGIDQRVIGLEHAGQYEHLRNELCKYYKEEQAQRFLFDNWKGFLLHNLPVGQ